MSERALLTIDRVAIRLGTTTARVYELARENIIPVVRLGRQLRIDPDELDKFIKNGGQALSGGWRRKKTFYESGSPADPDGI
jgi:excisionase family DNA binding protein